MKNTATTKRSFWAGAICLASVLGLSAPVYAADAGPCRCWYLGYEDGTEFAWDDRESAENYSGCSKQGRIKQYEEGFAVAAELPRFKSERTGRERTCPYGASTGN
jgi:hypothetical protein